MTSIKYDYNFLAGVYNGELEFNIYNLVIHLYIEADSEENQQIAFLRMDYFLNNFIDNSIFILKNETKVIKKYTEAGLKCITFDEPGPIDQIVQVTLVNKLNAITEDMLHIFESELSSLRGGEIKYMYFTTEDANEEYELISNDLCEWWNSSQPITISLNATEDVLNFKQHNTWKNLDLAWITNIPDENLNNPSGTTNIITMNIPEK